MLSVVVQASWPWVQRYFNFNPRCCRRIGEVCTASAEMAEPVQLTPSIDVLIRACKNCRADPSSQRSGPTGLLGQSGLPDFGSAPIGTGTTRQAQAEAPQASFSSVLGADLGGLTIDMRLGGADPRSSARRRTHSAMLGRSLDSPPQHSTTTRTNDQAISSLGSLEPQRRSSIRRRSQLGASGRGQQSPSRVNFTSSHEVDEPLFVPFPDGHHNFTRYGSTSFEEQRRRAVERAAAARLSNGRP